MRGAVDGKAAQGVDELIAVMQPFEKEWGKTKATESASKPASAPAHDDVATVLQFLKSRGYEETSVVVEGVLVRDRTLRGLDHIDGGGFVGGGAGMVVSDDGKTGLVMVGEKLDQATKLDPFKDGQRIRVRGTREPYAEGLAIHVDEVQAIPGKPLSRPLSDALDLMHLAEQLKKSLPAGGDLTMYGPSRLKGGIGNWEPAPEYSTEFVFRSKKKDARREAKSMIPVVMLWVLDKGYNGRQKPPGEPKASTQPLLAPKRFATWRGRPVLIEGGDSPYWPAATADIRALKGD